MPKYTEFQLKSFLQTKVIEAHASIQNLKHGKIKPDV